jgi:hypothetical protein
MEECTRPRNCILYAGRGVLATLHELPDNVILHINMKVHMTNTSPKVNKLHAVLYRERGLQVHPTHPSIHMKGIKDRPILPSRGVRCLWASSPQAKEYAKRMFFDHSQERWWWQHRKAPRLPWCKVSQFQPKYSQTPFIQAMANIIKEPTEFFLGISIFVPSGR